MFSKILFRSTFLFLSICLLASCQKGKQTEEEKDTTATSSFSEVDIKYAEGFRVREGNGFRLVDIQDPEGESPTTYHYALVPRNTTPQGIPQGYTTIEVPVRKAICMTALQMSHFIKLQATDKIVGIASSRYLFNKSIKKQLKGQTTHKIGIEGNFDTEKILALSPDIILVSPFKKGGFESIRDLGFPLVTFLAYKEPDPLGQAEWIKFVAMLLGMESEADSIFCSIEERYNTLKEQTQKVSNRPVVMSGELHAGNWYVVGGRSYLARLFEDAGANYFMREDQGTGGFYVDFETVLSKGATQADFWRILNSYDGDFSYDALQSSDRRYTDFKAFKNKQVIYCNLRQTPFYENTPLEPEVVLEDLIKIFHPDILPDHKPVYYYLLK